MIKRGSLIGTHEISVYQDAIIAEDSGGIFASVKKTIAGFNGGKVKLNINNHYDK